MSVLDRIVKMSKKSVYVVKQLPYKIKVCILDYPECLGRWVISIVLFDNYKEQCKMYNYAYRHSRKHCGNTCKNVTLNYLCMA